MAEQQMHGFRARLDYVLKHNQFISALFRKVASACMRFWGLFVPVDDKMVLRSRRDIDNAIHYSTNQMINKNDIDKILTTLES